MFCKDVADTRVWYCLHPHQKNPMPGKDDPAEAEQLAQAKLSKKSV